MSTKQQILEGARTEFQRNGFAGARMQAISETSGVNKALLHYHFKSKEELFRAVLLQSFAELLPRVLELLGSEMSLQEKLKAVVEFYISQVTKNPELPLFVMTELHRDKNFIKQNIKQVKGFPPNFVQQVNDAVKRGELIACEPGDVIANLMGLCIMPFVARPLLQHMTQKSDDEFMEFIEKRKQHVTELLLRGLFV